MAGHDAGTVPYATVTVLREFIHPMWVMSRVARFTDRGVGYNEAERLADKLVIRDRGSDDLRLCL